MTLEIEKILRSLSFSTISKFINIISGFITLPLVVSSIGRSDYGLFLLITAMSGYLGIMNFGITGTLKNRIVEAESKKDTDTVNSVISSVFLIYFILFFLTLIIFLLITLWLPQIYYSLLSEYTVTDKTSYIFFLIIFMTLMNTFVGSVVTNCFHGLNKIDLLAKIQSISSILFSIIYIVFLLYKPDLLWLVGFQLVRSLLTILINYLILKNSYKALKIRFSLHSFLFFRTLGKSSAYFFIASLFTTMASTLDHILISKLLGTAEISTFDISQKLYNFISSAFPVAFTSWPLVGKYYFQGRKVELETLIYKLWRLNFLFKVSMYIPVFIVYPYIIDFWLGHEFATQYSVYFLFLCIYCLNSIIGIMNLFLSATENQKSIIYLSLGNLIINASSSLILFFHFDKTIHSILMGTIIGQLFLLGAYNRSITKCLSIQIKFRKVWSYYIKIIPVIFLFILVKKIDFFIQNSLLQFFAIIFLIFAYIIYFYQLVLQEDEKQSIREYGDQLKLRIKRFIW